MSKSPMELKDFEVIATGHYGLIAVSPKGKICLYPYSAFLSKEQVGRIRTVHRMLREEKGEEVKRITGFSDILSYADFMFRQIRGDAERTTVFVGESN